MKGKVHLHPNSNTNGFDKNPGNINKNGSKPSIKKQLANIINQEGSMLIPSKKVLKTYKNGDVEISISTQKQIALKLIDWSISNNGSNSLRAIQMIMDSIDGKPKQHLEVKETDPIEDEYENYTDEELWEFMKKDYERIGINLQNPDIVYQSFRIKVNH